MAETIADPAMIRAIYAATTAKARFHTPFGRLTDRDRDVALKRTAKACGVSIEDVKAVVNG